MNPPLITNHAMGCVSNSHPAKNCPFNMNFYTGARVKWLSLSRPHELNLRDLGEVTAIIGTDIWVKWDKLDRSYKFKPECMIVLYEENI